MSDWRVLSFHFKRSFRLKGRSSSFPKSCHPVSRETNFVYCTAWEGLLLIRDIFHQAYNLAQWQPVTVFGLSLLLYSFNMSSLKGSKMAYYAHSIVCLLLWILLRLCFQVFKVNKFEFPLCSEVINRYFWFLHCKHQAAVENILSWLIDEKYFILFAI